MGTLILCKQQVAAIPYYIEETSLNVYSIEELSYYMLNNVYLLNNDFMNVELCNWIGRECKLNKLANELLDFIKNNAPLHMFVGHILAASGYASNREIKDLLAIIATFENKSEAECKKMRADRLMDKNKIVDAIYEYENLLAGDDIKTMTRPFVGDVHHNLACAYSRLYFFTQAMHHFEEAYKHNMKKSSLYMLLYAARCNGDKNEFESYVLKFQVPREEADEILASLKRITGKEDIVEFDARLDELGNIYQMDPDKLRIALGHVLEDWKTEYGKLCKI